MPRQPLIIFGGIFLLLKYIKSGIAIHKFMCYSLFKEVKQMTYTEVQLIKAGHGFWLVAHDDMGQKSYDFFNTKEKAMDFLASFTPYHGAVFTEAKHTSLAPTTTQEKIETYHSDNNACDCPDYRYRGGSYINKDSKRCCKHMLALGV